MRALFLISAIGIFFFGIVSWTTFPPGDALAWSGFCLYFFVIMVWAFIRDEEYPSGREEVGMLFWPIILVMLLVIIPVVTIADWVKDYTGFDPF